MYMIKQAMEILDKRRLSHSINVMQVCENLANFYGANQYSCKLAGIFHDITKYEKNNIQICQEYGILIEDENLLHAKTAAAICKYKYKLDDDICDAIAYHTTAKADMSLIAKILYIADFIEPNRKFLEVNALRLLAFKNLDDTLIKCIEISITELMEKKIPLHKDTVSALNFLYANRR